MNQFDICVTHLLSVITHPLKPLIFRVFRGL
jgi:hypothetical protein